MATMTKQQKLDTLEAVEARAFADLENADPKQVEFNNILNNVGLLRHITEMVKFGDPDLFIDQEEHNTCAPTLTPVDTAPVKPVAETVAETEDTAPWEEPAEELKLEDVRTRLITLNRAGVDLASVFQSFGVSKLSEVPKAKYGELLKMAEAAAEGVA